MRFDVFARIFIISLARSRERRRRMVEQIEAVGFDNVVLVDAVDGRQLDVDGLIRSGRLVRNSWTGRHLNAGEIGCLLSHVEVWRRMRDEGLSTALVMEDDVEI